MGQSPQGPLTRLAWADPRGGSDQNGNDLVEGLLEPDAGELFGADPLLDAQANEIHLRSWRYRDWQINDAAARDSVEVDLIVMLVNTDLSIWTIPRNLDRAVAVNLSGFQINPAVQGRTATLTRTMINQHGLRLGRQPIVAPVRNYVRNMGLAASAWHAVVAQAPHPPYA